MKNITITADSFFQGMLNASINYDLLLTLILGLVLSSFILTACWFVFNTSINAITHLIGLGRMNRAIEIYSKSFSGSDSSVSRSSESKSA